MLLSLALLSARADPGVCFAAGPDTRVSVANDPARWGDVVYRLTTSSSRLAVGASVGIALEAENAGTTPIVLTKEQVEGMATLRWRGAVGGGRLAPAGPAPVVGQVLAPGGVLRFCGRVEQARVALYTSDAGDKTSIQANAGFAPGLGGGDSPSWPALQATLSRERGAPPQRDGFVDVVFTAGTEISIVEDAALALGLRIARVGPAPDAPPLAPGLAVVFSAQPGAVAAAVTALTARADVVLAQPRGRIEAGICITADGLPIGCPTGWVCCYPCGTRGCDSRCVRGTDCGPPPP